MRQSKLYRQYESGNATKELLGTGHLQWSTTRKQGVYEGHDLYDHNNPTNEIDAYNYKKNSPKRRSPTTSTLTERYAERYDENLSDSFNAKSAHARQNRAATKKQLQQMPENILNLSPPRRRSYDPDTVYVSAGYDAQSGHQMWREVPKEPSPEEEPYSARGARKGRRGGQGASPLDEYAGMTANERVRSKEAAYSARALLVICSYETALTGDVGGAPLWGSGSGFPDPEWRPCCTPAASVI